MKLTAKARYAVTAMADLAAVSAQEPVALSEISVRQNISIAFLEQLFRKLKANNLVNSQRGAGGGYTLSLSPDQIRISDIVRAVDEPIRTTACHPGETIGCHGTSVRCLTHDLWDELGRHIDVFLGTITLEDVISKRVLGRAMISHPEQEQKRDGELVS